MSEPNEGPIQPSLFDNLPEKGDVTHYVYIMQVGDTYAYKIGMSNNIKRRLTELKRDSSDTRAAIGVNVKDLHVVGMIECSNFDTAELLEKFIHAFFNHRRLTIPEKVTIQINQREGQPKREPYEEIQQVRTEYFHLADTELSEFIDIAVFYPPIEVLQMSGNVKRARKPTQTLKEYLEEDTILAFSKNEQ